MILLDQLKIDARKRNHAPILRRLIERQIKEKHLSSQRLVRPLRWRVVKQSLDARDHDRIRWIYKVAVAEIDDPPEPFGCDRLQFKIGAHLAEKQSILGRPVVVGTGPAGYAAAILLAYAGLKPIVLEQGESVEARLQSVRQYWEGGDPFLNPHSNVQFGEGGAGTFSDGKLNTGTRSPWHRFILELFTQFGAPNKILIQQKPHIGTDYLAKLLPNWRNCILAYGGEVRFGHRVDRLVLEPDAEHSHRILGLEVTQMATNENYFLPCKEVIMAPGHSARKLMYALAASGIVMTPKTFAVGLRVEHPQMAINQTNYGKHFQERYSHLPAASYKAVAHLNTDRSVYTFCMCPGGQVVASASEPGRVVTNGMSRYLRNESMANSALLVNVYPTDTGATSEEPLKGFEFQDLLERRAFEAGGSTGHAPAQMVCDFLQDRLSTPDQLKAASYRPGVVPVLLSQILPDFVVQSLKSGFKILDQKLPGFISDEAILTAVESRSSSPIRIERDPVTGVATVLGLRVAGEGAGYAGGIMSAATDGLKMACLTLQDYDLTTSIFTET